MDVPGVVVDISSKASKDPEAKLEKDDLEAWVTEHGPLPDNCLVILRSVSPT